MSSSLLFSRFHRASLSRFVSFARNRLPRELIKELVVEMGTVGYINHDVMCQWNDSMLEHNRIIERGERMRLLPGRKSLLRMKFSCVDLYMLQMQSKLLANLLDNFSSFGERVLQLIHESPAALFWMVAGPILVERESWCRLCSQIMALLHALGMSEEHAARLELSPWPERAVLEAAAARAAGVFGLFARADATAPSVRALLSPAVRVCHAACDVPPAAELGRRAAKRGRSDPEPSLGLVLALRPEESRPQETAPICSVHYLRPPLGRTAGCPLCPEEIWAGLADIDIRGTRRPKRPL
jgi:hypothetical protein